MEFHYYAVYYLALQAGFPEADATVLAYSSQYLDNALVSYEVATERGPYSTIATHHFGFWDRDQEWEIWIPFHFFPAGPEASRPGRRDGSPANPLDVQPDSGPVKEMLVRALRTRNLYRVGIALHTYADSWAHQNFTGTREEWNRLDRRSALPPIGHAQAMRDPDQMDAAWVDDRLNGADAQVSNRSRFLACAGRIYRYLATYRRRSFADEELVLDRLQEILGPPERSEGERRDEFVIECGMEPYSRLTWRNEAFSAQNGWAGLDRELELESMVDKINWLKEELLHKTRILTRTPVKGSERFYDSHLYHWDQAARAHRTEALAQLTPLRRTGI